jgi:F420H(2)-dependent quinone reductase
MEANAAVGGLSGRHWGNKTGAIRKTPVGSQGGAPNDPAWAHNLRVNPHIKLRDEIIVRPMRVREIKDAAERVRLWTLAWRHTRRMRNIRRAQNVKFRCLSPSRNPPDQRPAA